MIFKDDFQRKHIVVFNLLFCSLWWRHIWFETAVLLIYYGRILNFIKTGKDF